MVFLLLAIRNLFRNRRRSLATLLALAIGASSILIFGGFTANVRYSLQTAYVRAGGHLQIQHRDFFHYGSGDPASYGIVQYPRIIEALRADAELAGMMVVVSPMLQFGGVAGNYDAGVSRTVLGTGYVPEDVNRMRQWNEFGLRDRRPHFALEGAPIDSAVIGQGVARVLQLCDQLGVEAKPCARDPTAQPARVWRVPACRRTSRRWPRPSTTAPSPPPRRARRSIELLVSQSRGAPNVAALT
jgi:putative ABC transport system permease protein